MRHLTKYKEHFFNKYYFFVFKSNPRLNLLS